MRQIIPNDDSLQQTLRETRALAIQNARYSLKNFLLEEKLPLDDLANTDDIDELVDKILKRSKEDSGDFDLKGDPYLNCKHKLRTRKNDEDLDERNRYSDGEEDFELDFGDGDVVEYNADDEDTEEEENFSESVLAEKSRKWDIFRNFRTVPATAGTAKLTQAERNLLIKNAGLVKENKDSRHFKETQDAKELLQERARINKSDKHLARRVIGDIEIKKRLK